ncbi:hypothetical protein NMY22_g14398 [Coprinellus aureogranulatus]|nr:hypothetical protein NMY22_g14398 [Coprinellus aureogranulatus]
MGHTHTVSRFLKGEVKYTPAHIIQLWEQHPAGRVRKEKDRAVMYSLDVPYTAADVDAFAPSRIVSLSVITRAQLTGCTGLNGKPRSARSFFSGVTC